MNNKNEMKPEIETSLFENGQKSFEGNFKDGKEDGLITSWVYKDGKKHGFLTWWFESGQKSSEGIFKDGKKEGLHTWWDENGNKWIEDDYKDGVKEKKGLVMCSLMTSRMLKGLQKK